MNWLELIRRRNVWIDHNFPGGEVIDSVIGCVEEAGELARGHLKLKQGIRKNEDHAATIDDSVADLIIYLLGVFSRIGPPTPRAIVNTIRDADQLLLKVAENVGCLAGIAAEEEGGPQAERNAQVYASNIVHYLERYCAATSRDFEALVMTTWAQVEERDWIKYPDTGRALVEGDVRNVAEIT